MPAKSTCVHLPERTFNSTSASVLAVVFRDMILDRTARLIDAIPMVPLGPCDQVCPSRGLFSVPASRSPCASIRGGSRTAVVPMERNA